MKKYFFKTIALLVVLFLLAGCKSSEYRAAEKSFEEAVLAVSEKNSKLDSAIMSAQQLITKGEPALDDTLVTALSASIDNAKTLRCEVPEMPSTASDINSVTSQLNSVDYSTILEDIVSKQSALELSIKQYSKVNAPTEEYVISCLESIEDILDIEAVTEDNDPNGNLNKAGGYTSQVYFSCKLINQSDVYGTSVIDKGTDCGGSIEVYSTPKDAMSRNEYLATFDGSFLSVGSHRVVGTVIVRTSDMLTASQQKALESEIISALTKVD